MDFSNDTELLASAITAMGAIVATALKFAVRRIVRALDASTAAHLEFAKAAAVLSTKIDRVSEWVEDHTPMREPPPLPPPPDDYPTPVEPIKVKSKKGGMGTYFRRPQTKER